MGMFLSTLTRRKNRNCSAVPVIYPDPEAGSNAVFPQIFRAP